MSIPMFAYSSLADYFETSCQTKNANSRQTASKFKCTYILKRIMCPSRTIEAARPFPATHVELRSHCPYACNFGINSCEPRCVIAASIETTMSSDVSRASPVIGDQRDRRFRRHSRYARLKPDIGCVTRYTVVQIRERKERGRRTERKKRGNERKSDCFAWLVILGGEDRCALRARAFDHDYGRVS